MLGDAPARAVIFGASARVIWDLADWDESSMLLNLGQSGHADSPHYRDQLDAWRAGEVQRIAFSAERVERECVRRLGLTPASDVDRKAG